MPKASSPSRMYPNKTSQVGRPLGVAEPFRRSRRNGTLEDKLDHWAIPEPNSGCLLWFGPVNEQGYPRIHFRGKNYRGNRLVWQQKRGPIPVGLHVLHSCDVTCCVNDQHLFLGTNDQNVADKMRKKRHRTLFGDKHRNTKIPDSEIPAIIASAERGVDLAERYGVTPALISYIRLQRGRKHLK